MSTACWICNNLLLDGEGIVVKDVNGNMKTICDRHSELEKVADAPAPCLHPEHNPPKYIALEQ